MDKFPCTSCGACCRKAKQAAEGWQNAISKLNVSKEVKESLAKEMTHPYGFDGSGKCEMLAEDNTCKVYENRPSMCNIEKAREIMGWPKDLYYNASINNCNSLMDAFGVEEKFRIKKT